jgi:NifU-like protein
MRTHEKHEAVRSVLQLVEPAMEADGGGIAAFELDGNVVKVQLKGTCLYCPSVKMTLKFSIEKTLKTHLPWVEAVVPLGAG